MFDGVYQHHALMRDRVDAILTGDVEPQRAVAWFGLALVWLIIWRHFLAMMR